MNKNLFNSFLSNLKNDLPSSLVAFLVALPLSLGIALASGAPIKAGLIAAVVGGIVVGLLGGAPLQVSGPAAGLTVMVFGFIHKFGFSATCFITILAGVMQIALGLLKVGELTLVISPSVIEAMLAGIGILIALGQAFVLMGGAPHGAALSNVFHFKESFENRNNHALLLGLATLAVLWAWNKFLAGKFKSLPGSLVAVVFGTTISIVLGLELPKVSIDPNIFSSITFPHWNDLINSPDIGSLLISALALTVVASAESLLCAVATDKLFVGPRARLNRELVGQGFANLISGLLGGLPVTGVIVRSSANIGAGAKSATSSILHGVWLFIFATFMSYYLTFIPLSVLAALLIYTGIKLVKLQEVKKLAEFNESIIYFVTLTGVVFINLLWGIGLGFTLAAVVLIFKMSRFQFHQFENENNLSVVITGNLNFLTIPKLKRKLDGIPSRKTVELIIDVDVLDHAALQAVRNWKDNYEKIGGTVIKEPLEKVWANVKLKSTSEQHEFIYDKYIIKTQKSEFSSQTYS